MRSVVALARALRLQTTAEGIETEQQWRELCQLGCDYGQGFLYAPAVPAQGAERLLARSHFDLSRAEAA